VAGTQVKILVPGNHLMAGLLGQRDELLRLVEGAFDDVHIAVRGNEISIAGEGAERVGALFEELIILLESGQGLDAVQVNRTIDMMHDDLRPSEVLTAELLRSARGRAVRPKTGGQKTYADAIASNIVTFAIGPAGTGKSYLAVALAVQALQARQVDRIILTRPAVEAGERLGFLPGDLMAKVDPYLRPLYDALHDMLGRSRPVGVHARAHAQQQLHHPRRSPERQPGADEDVPHPHRLRLEGRHHRRRHPDRRAWWPIGPGGPRAALVLHRRPCLRVPHLAGCGAAPYRGRHRRRLRTWEADGRCR
jgi:hypothetical protein